MAEENNYRRAESETSRRVIPQRGQPRLEKDPSPARPQTVDLSPRRGSWILLTRGGAADLIFDEGLDFRQGRIGNQRAVRVGIASDEKGYFIS